MLVQLYFKQNCPLCEDAKETILEVQERLAFAFQEVDIESDPVLYERYKYDVPVVTLDGTVIFRHRLLADALEERLRANGTPVAQ